MKLRARDVMTTTVLTVGPDWPVERLAEFLIEHGISGAPVVDGSEELVGVVSTSDIARHAGLPLHVPEGIHPHDYHAQLIPTRFNRGDLAGFRVEEGSGATVADIMTRTIYRVSEDTPVQQVADTLIRGRIHRLFVTRKDELVGIVSALDLLAIVRDLETSP